MAKNAFLKKMQAKNERDSMNLMDLTERFARQAMHDAALLTLAYGKCMGNDPWGPKRLEAFGRECLENYWFVMDGAQFSPDADAVRAQIDKLLKAKLPEDIYCSWPERYRGWVEESIEGEAQNRRSKWARGGMDTKHDGGTSQLLKGVGKE